MQGNWDGLGWNILAIVCLVAWCSALTALLCFCLRRLDVMAFPTNNLQDPRGVQATNNTRSILFSHVQQHTHNLCYVPLLSPSLFPPSPLCIPATGIGLDVSLFMWGAEEAKERGYPHDVTQLTDMGTLNGTQGPQTPRTPHHQRQRQHQRDSGAGPNGGRRHGASPAARWPAGQGAHPLQPMQPASSPRPAARNRRPSRNQVAPGQVQGNSRGRGPEGAPRDHPLRHAQGVNQAPRAAGAREGEERRDAHSNHNNHDDDTLDETEFMVPPQQLYRSPVDSTPLPGLFQAYDTEDSDGVEV